jgi:hypothetical protein
MNFTSKVIFEYDIFAGRVKETALFKDLDELKQIIKGASYQKPFTVRVSRSVQIIDNRFKRDNQQQFWFVDPEYTNPSIRAEFECEHIDFMVMDKLIMPNELRKNVATKYKNITNLDLVTRFEYEPVKNFKIVEKLKDDKISRLLFFNPLMPRDIVVDEKMNQIWPQKTGTTPKALTEMLARNKEVIR